MDTMIKDINSNLQEIIDGLAEMKDVNGGILAEVETKIAEKNEEVRLYKTEVETNKQNIKDLEEQVNTLETDLAELKERFGKKEYAAVVETAKREINAQIAEKKSKITKHKKKIKELTEKGRSTKELLASLKKDKVTKEKKLETVTTISDFYNVSIGKIIAYATEHPNSLEGFFIEPEIEEEKVIETSNMVFEEEGPILSYEYNPEPIYTGFELTKEDENEEDSAPEINMADFYGTFGTPTNDYRFEAENDFATEAEPVVNDDFMITEPESINLEVEPENDFSLDTDFTIEPEFAISEEEETNFEFNNETPAEESIFNSESVDMFSNGFNAEEATEEHPAIIDHFSNGFEEQTPEITEEVSFENNEIVEPIVSEEIINEPVIQEQTIEVQAEPIANEVVENDLTKFLQENNLDITRIPADIIANTQITDFDNAKRVLGILRDNNIDIAQIYDALLILNANPENLNGVITKLLLADQTISNIGLVLGALPLVNIEALGSIIESYGPNIKEANITDLVIKGISEVVETNLEYVKNLGFNDEEIASMLSTLPADTIKGLTVFPKISTANYYILNKFGINNIKDVFSGYAHMFLLNPERFDAILEKYNPEDLVRCVEKNAAVIEKL